MLNCQPDCPYHAILKVLQAHEIKDAAQLQYSLGLPTENRDIILRNQNAALTLENDNLCSKLHSIYKALGT